MNFKPQAVARSMEEPLPSTLLDLCGIAGFSKEGLYALMDFAPAGTPGFAALGARAPGP